MENELNLGESTKKKHPANDTIKIINSLIKSVVVLCFAAIICYKLIVSNINFDFSKFDFSDLLALILAIFSIGLSVVFYFKATDTSNLFYDNTYKFTKDISEILGRIEAGFGERLKHLDEGYWGLKNKFDGNVIGEKHDGVEDAKKALDEEKKKLEVQMKEKEKILQTLMNKAKLTADEKESFIKKINEKEEVISSLNSELMAYRRNLSEREISRDISLIGKIPPRTRQFLMDFLKFKTDVRMIAEAPLEYISEQIKMSPNLPHLELNRLIELGVINPDFTFTINGLELLKSLAKRILS